MNSRGINIAASRCAWQPREGSQTHPRVSISARCSSVGMDIAHEVSIDLPSLMAHMEAPLPRCITIKLVLSFGLSRNWATERRMNE